MSAERYAQLHADVVEIIEFAGKALYSPRDIAWAAHNTAKAALEDGYLIAAANHALRSVGYSCGETSAEYLHIRSMIHMAGGPEI
jgi:hypothetical protein